MKSLGYTIFVLICGIPFVIAAGLAFLVAKWVDFCCRRSVTFTFAREWWLKLLGC